MGQDLREMFLKDRKKKKHAMKKGHKTRFEKRLNEELPTIKKTTPILVKVAASVLILIGAAVFFYMNNINDTNITTTIVSKDDVSKDEKGTSFGDLSPDLKKIENYYTTNINITLSQLQVPTENKTMVDSFMEHLSVLNDEYIILNKELNAIGPNDQIVSALIKNLQLRLQLLQKLKKKLNELKASKDEQII